MTKTLTPPLLREKTPANDLRWVFGSDEPAATRSRALAFLGRLYRDHGAAPPGESPGYLTIEQFYLPMPTAEAWESEVGLCDAIAMHHQGLLGDAEMKNILVRFSDAHTLVHDSERSGPKVGNWQEVTKAVDLFAFSWQRDDQRYFAIVNPVQMWLLYLLEKELGGEKFRCREL